MRGDLGSIPGLGRSPEREKGYPLQYSGLENSMDCIVHGVAKSRTRLSGFYFTSLQGTDCAAARRQSNYRGLCRAVFDRQPGLDRYGGPGAEPYGV